jgi:hypothetical protein
MHVCVVGFIRIIVLLIIWAIGIFGWKEGKMGRKERGMDRGVGGYLSVYLVNVDQA